MTQSTAESEYHLLREKLRADPMLGLNDGFMRDLEKARRKYVETLPAEVGR